MKRFYTFFLIVILLNSWHKIADAQIVKMPDANLAAAVRNALNLRPGTTITKQHLQDLDLLDAPESNIKDLTGLEHATQLDGLWLWDNQIRDITPLTDLTELRWLALGGNQITNITPLKNLTQLRDLWIGDNEIRDITSLANLTQLRGLGLGRNQITNITPLKNLTRLEGLWLWDSEISDITPLSGLTRLTHLGLGDNQIDDISLVAGFTRLEELYIGRNNISDITPLANLTRLQILMAWRNEIRDISPLRNLVRLRELDLRENFITDITVLGGLRVLENLFLRDNSIQDVSILTKLTRLKELRLAENPIQDGAPLRTLLDQYPHLKLDVNIAQLTRVAKPTVKGHVKMPDANLAAAVRKALGLGANARITKQAIQGLTHLDARDSQIKNLTGLEDATQLTELDLDYNEIRDVSPLAKLTQLKRLRLDGNQISNIQPLTGLTQLEALLIGGNQINNAEVRRLTKLKQLKWLALWGNPISNITPLAKLTKLEELWIGGNKIRDVSPLAGLVNLRTLHLKGNPIDDLSPLANLPNLRDVDIDIPKPSHGVIADPILAASVRRALDLGPNAPITKQKLRKLTKLTADYQGIEDLIGLEHATQLEVLSLAGNQIRDVSPLAGLTELKVLVLDYNPIQGTGRLLALLKRRPNLILTINVPRDEHPPIYWLTNLTTNHAGDRVTSPVKLQRLTSVSQTVETLWESSSPITEQEMDLAMDTVAGKLYWTEKIDESRSEIKRANLDGSNLEKLKTLDSIILSLAVDPKQRKLYWTNSRGRIQGSNLNAKQIKTFVQGLNNPHEITVDAARRQFYWIEGDSIRRANFNGKNIQSVLTATSATGQVNNIDSLAIAGDKIYWSQNDQDPTKFPLSFFFLGSRILRANLNGSNIEELATLMVSGDVFVVDDLVIDVAGETLYYTSTSAHIMRLDLNGDSEPEIAVHYGGIAGPETIALATPLDAVAAAPINSARTSAEIQLPEATRLLANYPNPFNPETWIPYQLAEDSEVSIRIYDTTGAVVRRLQLGHQPAGIYGSRSRAAYWDGRNNLGEPVASGVYFYTLSAGDFTATRKLLIRK